MNTLKVTLVLIAAILMQSSLLAEENSTTTPEETDPFKGDVQLGYLMSSGNTETTTLNGKIKVLYNQSDWLHELSVEAFSTSDENTTTAERYKVDYQIDKKLDEERYLFGNASYEVDRFSGYEYVSTLAAGYGHQLYKDAEMFLDTEVGIGYRLSEIAEENIVPGEDPEITELLLRLAIKYNWQIAKDKSLTSELKVDAGEESTISNFEIGFVTMIAGDLSFKVAFEARHNSEVPVGTENLDTITSLNLLYAF